MAREIKADKGVPLAQAEVLQGTGLLAVHGGPEPVEVDDSGRGALQSFVSQLSPHRSLQELDWKARAVD